MQVKKLTALLLALVRLLSLLPAAAIAAENEDYELRVLTFEDADYKAGENFAGGSNWSSLIDEPQYGGKLLYGSGGSGVSSADEAYNWTDSGNTELFSRLSEGYGTWCYWSGGHAVSNYNSGDIAAYGGYAAQLTVYKAGVAGLSRTGGGHNGSDNFAVHFGYADNSEYGLKEDALPTLSFADNAERVIDSMWVTNTTYALNCYIDGNGLTAKIGDDDWVKLVATGYNAAGAKTGTAELYLCNGPKNIVMDWTKWDLSGLGKVQRVTFNVTGSSDNGYGFSQPAYFAYDDVAVRFEKEAKPVPATGVTLDRQALSLSVGETAALTAVPQPENTTDALSWSSSAPAVASVKDGVVTALSAGETVITAACGSAEATCAVTVTQPPLSVKAGDTACVVKQAGENIYHASAAYGSDVTIEVKDASFLMVTDSKQGYINDEGANPFTLTAAQLEKLLLADGAELPFTPAQASKVAYLSIMDGMAGKTYELYIERTRELTPATEITLDRTELSLKLSETAVLKASVQPENTTDTLSWSSSEPAVASVKDGLVTALAPGKATITAVCGSVQAQCAVTVAEAVLAQRVVLSKAELKLYTGDTAKLSAEVLPADTTDKTVTWSSSNQEVATVEGGRITALKAGESEITARCGEAKASCRLRVEDAAEPALTDGVYQIGTASELVWFAKQVNGVSGAISAALTKDVDLEGVVWTPIGAYPKKFSGSFDGKGHTIRNLCVDYETAAQGERVYLGLFGCVEGTKEQHAVIRALQVEGSVQAASGFSVYTGAIGGIVGDAKYAELSGLVSRVAVSADENVGKAADLGGLGGVLVNCTLTNCGNEGDVSGVKNLGGVCYELYSGTMTGCYNTGSVTGTGTCVGGLMGYAKQAQLTNVYNTGNVSTAKNQIGGLIGVMEKASLTNAYNTGMVTVAETGGTQVGAVAGWAETLSNVYYLEGSAVKAFGKGEATAEAKSAEALKALAPTLGDGFAADSAVLNGGYPILRWQAAEETLLGDVNGDGVVNNLDAALTYAYFNGKRLLSDAALAAADVNRDGKVDNQDAALIYALFNGKIKNFSDAAKAD